MFRAILLSLCAVFCLSLSAQTHKMSRLVREAAASSAMRKAAGPDNRRICAFVKVDGDGAESLLKGYGCMQLARYEDVVIATIPLRNLVSLSQENQVKRIEASRSCSLQMDTTAIVVNALPVYSGTLLPQAYTGEGVVMGVMDVGFDLTHPTFYDSTATNYRIRRLWDQISPDSVGSGLVVGRDFVSEEELLSVGCSYDNKMISHGTHTAGIAAGSGYDSPYRGVAFGSDLCLVNNAVSENVELIAAEKLFLFTTAMDALGFQYIFDYAESVGKPCVISFSEGFTEDFSDEDALYEQTLNAMLGKGKILVAAAGNGGGQYNYFRKPKGQQTAGTCAYNNNADSTLYAVFRSKESFTMKMMIYRDGALTDSLVIDRRTLNDSVSRCDTVLTDQLERYVVTTTRYPSGYDATDTACVMNVVGPQGIGLLTQVAIVAESAEADVECIKAGNTVFYNYSSTPWQSAERSHSMHLPAGYERIISVGATSYRDGFVTFDGSWKSTPSTGGTDGSLATYSSRGPSMTGVLKPEVVAPGNNVVSAYSSFYEEASPDAADLKSDVARFDFRGRTYAWNSNTGTSMSAPVVAGAVALWLQANPWLSPEEVKETFAVSCTHPEDSIDYPNTRYGYGQIDVYKGLLHVLTLDRLPSLSQSLPKRAAIEPTHDGQVSITFDEAPVRPFTVILYDTSGHQLSTHTVSPDGTCRFLLPAARRGVLAVQLNAAAVVGSNLIRIP